MSQSELVLALKAETFPDIKDSKEQMKRFESASQNNASYIAQTFLVETGVRQELVQTERYTEFRAAVTSLSTGWKNTHSSVNLFQ